MRMMPLVYQLMSRRTDRVILEMNEHEEIKENFITGKWRSLVYCHSLQNYPVILILDPCSKLHTSPKVTARVNRLRVAIRLMPIINPRSRVRLF